MIEKLKAYRITCDGRIRCTVHDTDPCYPVASKAEVVFAADKKEALTQVFAKGWVGYPSGNIFCPRNDHMKLGD